nr:NTP transferase domain-containing protein [Micromonospora kangleipakensis]
MDGEPLVRRAVRLLRAGGCAPVHAVVGAGADALPELRGAVPVVNPHWRNGLGGSLRRGLASLPGHVRAAGAPVAAAGYAGRIGHPVLLGRAVWPLLDRYATGDRGARDLLRARPDLVTVVPCDGLGSPLDVDTPGDLARHAAAGHQE